MTTKKHDEEAAEETKAAAKPKAKKPAPEPASGKEAVAENGAATAEPAAEHPVKKEPKERTFVDAKTGKAIAHPHQGGSGAEGNQAVRCTRSATGRRFPSASGPRCCGCWASYAR